MTIDHFVNSRGLLEGDVDDAGVVGGRNLEPSLVGAYCQVVLHPDELLAVEGVAVGGGVRSEDGCCLERAHEAFIPREAERIGLRRNQQDGLRLGRVVLHQHCPIGGNDIVLGSRGRVLAYCGDAEELHILVLHVDGLVLIVGDHLAGGDLHLVALVELEDVRGGGGAVVGAALGCGGDGHVAAGGEGGEGDGVASGLVLVVDGEDADVADLTVAVEYQVLVLDAVVYV